MKETYNYKNTIKSLKRKEFARNAIFRLQELCREWCRRKRNEKEASHKAANSDGLNVAIGFGRAKEHPNTKVITFFYSDLSEYLSLKPVAHVAHARGYKTEFSINFRRPVEIGVYCNHRPDATNSRFSIVMLHQIGQDYWPECPAEEENAWSFAPWDAFDIGILPGRASSQAWYSVSQHAYSRPRLGVFELGNPKSDRVFNDRTEFEKEVIQLRKVLGLKDRPTVLYAPSYTSDEKQDDFVQSLIHLPFNLLIKHYPWVDPANQDRISRISVKYQGLTEKSVYIVEPEIDITTCLALSDVVVSDESNCLVEALLFEVPGISVMDWIIPQVEYFGEIYPPRTPNPPPCAIKMTRANLGTAVKDAIQNRDRLRPRLRQYRAYYYSHLGRSSDLTLDVIDAALSGTSWPVEPLLPKLSGLFDDMDMDRENKAFKDT
jgi:hypothetical protein